MFIRKNLTAFEKIELKKTIHTLIAPGIIRIDGKSGVHIDYEDVLEMREANLKLSGNKPFCTIMNGDEHFHTYSKEAKEMLASSEYCKLRKAAAFVLSNLAAKMLVTFFLKVNKPSSPSKVFSNEKDAIEWLKTIRLH